MKKFLSIIILLFSVNIVEAKPVVDVTKIAGQSQETVVAYLGKEISCDESELGKKCIFTKGDTEIVFIDGKADWITIDAIDNISFSKLALKALGLKVRKPSFKSSYILKWIPLEGLRSVSIFKKSAKADYALIKVKTQ